MGKWIFTFGANQPLAGYCQPIYASNFKIARDKMFEVHGEVWAFQYSEEEWKEQIRNPERFWNMEKELNPIYVEEES